MIIMSDSPTQIESSPFNVLDPVQRNKIPYSLILYHLLSLWMSHSLHLNRESLAGKKPQAAEQEMGVAVCIALY